MKPKRMILSNRLITWGASHEIVWSFFSAEIAVTNNSRGCMIFQALLIIMSWLLQVIDDD